MFALNTKGVLEQLRERFPDEDWKAVREGFSWGYTNNKGYHGQFVACLAPRYDGDDDHFVSRFYIYKPNEPTEALFF